MAVDARRDPATRTGALRRIGEQLGIKPETLRNWVTQAEIDEGHRPGTTTDDAARLAELERAVRELRRANAILRSASARFRISISIFATRSFPAQAHQLAPLVTGRALDTASVNVIELHPPPQARLGDPQVMGDLSDRLLPLTGQLHRPAAELRRLGCRHPGLLSKAILASDQVSGKPGQAPRPVDAKVSCSGPRRAMPSVVGQSVLL